MTITTGLLPGNEAEPRCKVSSVFEVTCIADGRDHSSCRNRADAGQWVALWPTLVPAIAGTLWYLYGMAALGSDSGREYFAGPFYLLAGTLAMTVVAIFAFIMTRSRS